MTDPKPLIVSDVPLIAVIELGSTSIRMMIASPGPDGRGKARILDTLQQTVSLGRDTFTTGAIRAQTTEACVSAVISFRRVMQEYGITRPEHIRVIASSAVREAINREAFLDRIFVATGIAVTVIEEAEVNRLTYRAVRPLLGRQPFFKTSDTLVAEVGGGSTETLLFHRGRVVAAQMHKLGSLRLAKAMDMYAVSRRREQALMSGSIDQAIEAICAALPPAKRPVMLALGGDIRFAASLLQPEWDRHALVSITTADLETLARQLAEMSLEEIVRVHHLSYENAETLYPALLIYIRLAQSLHLRRFFVAEVNLRNGLLAEMESGGNWTAEFKHQIISSALEVARRYEVDLGRARHVAATAMSLLSFLRARHAFSHRDEMLLTVAALLHETGRFINLNAYHKHTGYIIANSDLFGLGTQDVALAAQIARYHRRSMPKPTHNVYMQLSREDRLTVSRLAAILRVASAVDGLPSRRPVPLRFREHDGVLSIMTDVFANLPMIQQRISASADLFEQIYGLRVNLRQTTKDTSS